MMAQDVHVKPKLLKSILVDMEKCQAEEKDVHLVMKSHEQAKSLSTFLPPRFLCV